MSFHNDISSDEVMRQVNLSNNIKIPFKRSISILRSDSTNSIANKLDANSEDNDSKRKNRKHKHK